MSTPRPIVSIVANIVTIANDNITVVYSESKVVSGSAEAEAYCASLDVGQGTKTSVVKYTVTYEGEGYGSVVNYTPKVFKTQIEPLYQ